MERRSNGFTLLEMLIAILLMSVIALGAVAIFDSLPAYYNRLQQETATSQSAEAVLDLMASELRWARRISVANLSPRQIVFENAQNQVITYDWNSNQIRRSVAGGSRTILLNGVTSSFFVTYVACGNSDSMKTNKVCRIDISIWGYTIGVHPRAILGDQVNGWYQ